jgi:xanthine/CO dehydrogenase XdhC/CoxF family maturation factor
MKELAQILAAAQRLRREGRPFALATVVKINGSTYRRPGARMLISEEGATCGTISGGCLEQEVAQQAFAVLEGGRPQVLPFDLSDDDLILGYGTGCTGVVHVLLEPLPSPGRTDPTELVQACFDGRRAGVLASVIEAEGRPDALGCHLLRLDDGTHRGDPVLAPLHATLAEEMARTRALDRSQIRRHALPGGAVEVLYEIVRPPARLLVFGSGHDVAPVVQFARGLGWPVTVIGRKPAEDLARRFPDAGEHVFLMHPEDLETHVTFDGHTAALVMNHSYLRDKGLLRALLRLPVRYVGVLGPRARCERLKRELQAEDPGLAGDRLAALHGPVGLDIGTETPEEIALSVVAEIQAVFHGRQGGMLRHRTEAIHEDVPVT